MYRIGIIGCGGIFEMHAVPIRMLDKVSLVSVCDIEESRAQEKASVYGCRYYVDYREMMDTEELDCIHICTPHDLHPVIAMEAMKRKIHVITEKPMAIFEDDAKQMVTCARENHVALDVIFQNRYNPGSILVKRELDSGKLGKVLSARVIVTWDRGLDYYNQSNWKGTTEKEGGGVIIDQAIHSLDLARWIIGGKATYVDAAMGNRLHPGAQVEDYGEGVVYIGDVPVLFYTANYFTTDAPVLIEFHCTNAVARIEGDTGEVRYKNGLSIRADVNPEEFIDFGEQAKSYWGTSHYKQIANFYQKLLPQFDETGQDAEEHLLTQQMIALIYQSARQKKILNLTGSPRAHDITTDIENA